MKQYEPIFKLQCEPGQWSRRGADGVFLLHETADLCRVVGDVPVDALRQIVLYCEGYTDLPDYVIAALEVATAWLGTVSE